MAGERAVAVLGTGIMGAPMARNLLRAGHAVRAWNRTKARAEPLARDGAVVCESAAEAAAGADVLLTMLHDGAAVQSAMTDEVFAALPAGAVWAQMSTVGLKAADQLYLLAREHGVGYVDAPVLGTRKPAEEGALTVFAAGPPSLRERVQPAFDAVAARTMWVGESVEGSKLKLVANNWVLALTAALGETMALAEALGFEPETFLEVIRGGPLDSPYAHVKGALITSGEFPPSFKTASAVKDAGLVAEAARAAGLTPLVAEAVRDQMRRAADLGHGDEDMAAVYYAAREPD